jgi:hypothetical protein
LFSLLKLLLKKVLILLISYNASKLEYQFDLSNF